MTPSGPYKSLSVWAGSPAFESLDDEVELPPDWVEFEDDDGTLPRGGLDRPGFLVE